MTKMILVLDESGAKGYAKIREKHEGEVGVIAGFLYTEPEIRTIESSLSKILESFSFDINKKLHITDLEKSQQQLLREHFFLFIKSTKMQWIFQAQYSEGFYQSEFADDRGGSENAKESLHVTLFQGVLIQALGMAHSIGIRNLNLEIKTDPVDKTTLKKFTQAANYISNIFLQRENFYFRYADPNNSGKFVKEHYSTTIKSDSLKKFDEIQLAITIEDSPLTILADVLANSVRYYLEKSQKNNPNIFLNNKAAIIDHPLVDLAFAPTDAEHVLPVQDIIYRRTTD